MGGLSRRDAVKGLARVGALLAAGGFVGPRAPALAQDDPVLAGRPLVRYPEKTDLILLTSRPPQLETPMKYFDRAITPNEAFFVRHHVFPIPLEIDLATWRLRVTGRVDGGYGVEEVQISTDGGAVWRRADLGADLGRYSFREWSSTWTPSQPGLARLMVRAFNRIGQSQPREALWNPTGWPASRPSCRRPAGES
jgi:hypothetical protein